MHLRGYAAAPLPPAAFLGHLSYLSSSLWVFACHLPPLLLFLGTSESFLDENPFRKDCVEAPTLLIWTVQHPHTAWGKSSLAQAAQQLPLGASVEAAPVLPNALWWGTAGMIRWLPEGLQGLVASRCRQTCCRCPQAEKGTHSCHQKCHRDGEGPAFPRSGVFGVSLSNLSPPFSWLISTLPSLL